jgi:hypothetical protein
MTILAFLFVLTFTSSAFAESWVMWVEQDSARATKPSWDFKRDIYDNRAGCNAALPQELNNRIKLYQSIGHELLSEKDTPVGVMYVRKDPPNRIVRGLRDNDKQKSWVIMESFYCFPVGLDPRER